MIQYVPPIDITPPIISTRQEYPSITFREEDFKVKMASRCKYTLVGKIYQFYTQTGDNQEEFCSPNTSWLKYNQNLLHVKIYGFFIHKEKKTTRNLNEEIKIRPNGLHYWDFCNMEQESHTQIKFGYIHPPKSIWMSQPKG